MLWLIIWKELSMSVDYREYVHSKSHWSWVPKVVSVKNAGAEEKKKTNHFLKYLYDLED